jgi:hypothetical protein
VLPALVQARSDEPIGNAVSTRVWLNEEVVHDPYARGTQRVPAPVDRREADRCACVVACDQLDAFPVRVCNQSLREGNEVLVGR